MFNLEPPNIIINPNEWITAPKAAFRMRMPRTMFYTYVYEFVFKNILYIDGTMYFNIEEIAEKRKMLDERIPILPTRVPYEKRNPRIPKSCKPNEISNPNPIVDFYENSSKSAKNYLNLPEGYF